MSRSSASATTAASAPIPSAKAEIGSKRIVAVKSPRRSHEALFAPVGIFFSFFSTTLATFFLLSLCVLFSAAASAVPCQHFPVEQLIDGADKVVPVRSQFVNALARDILE